MKKRASRKLNKAKGRDQGGTTEAAFLCCQLLFVCCGCFKVKKRKRKKKAQPDQTEESEGPLNKRNLPESAQVAGDGPVADVEEGAAMQVTRVSDDDDTESPPLRNDDSDSDTSDEEEEGE